MARYKEYGYDIQNGKAIIPKWKTEIKEEAFEDCEELTSVELPQWIKKIGDRAFSLCSSLTSISIPSSVTEIGNWAFYGCSSLTEVRIPKGCNVHESAFKDCTKVKIIRY